MSLPKQVTYTESIADFTQEDLLWEARARLDEAEEATQAFVERSNGDPEAERFGAKVRVAIAEGRAVLERAQKAQARVPAKGVSATSYKVESC